MRMRKFSAAECYWDGLILRLGSRRGRVLAQVIPDPDWPKMLRVKLPGHALTDMVNLSRAKDAAVCLVLAEMGETRVSAA